ncbi:MAG: hypothetical protein E2590_16225 [Chryseobacterium sp.]|nr:hypothetical protein [Chryseobacterium sp.]
MNKNIKFFTILFVLICFNTFSQTKKNNNCFSINPFINSFIENLIIKDVNLNKNYLALISLKDDNGNYNIDLALTYGDIKTSKTASFKEMKLGYGNIEILLMGKTDEDLKFLKKSIKKTKKIFINKDLSKDNKNFYDEDYVWSTFFNHKKELINMYIPEEKESAYQIFNNLKNEIKISPSFKNLDCNCF